MEKYQTLQILGQGSFGTVYLIKDSRNKKFALKKIQINPFKVDEALKQIEVMTKLKHPNLVHIYQYYYDNQEKLQILMQFCEEGDLLAYLKKNKKQIPLKQLINIFQQIVKAFIVMNVKGIIHRDLKPENVLLSNKLIVKIADFGCAREGEFSKVVPGSFDKGTPIYSSPQQLTNQLYSAKCDVWSAGCVLYFLYFGTHPFIDLSVHHTLIKIKKLTQDKDIKLDDKADPTIAKFISLSLIYEDKNRASWRQLYLSRLFNKKIGNVQNFLIYLWSISNIASWITGQFWKNRKYMTIQKNKNQLFAYFMIKFQYTIIKMGIEITNKSTEYSYLFTPTAYDKFDPIKANITNDLRKQLSKKEGYYKSIKNNMTGKQVYSLIEERQPQRISCFSDLDHSIRAGYKILQDVLPQLKSTKRDKSKKESELIWVLIAKWINFESWFPYQKQPRIQDCINKIVLNPSCLVEQQLQKYLHGILD